MIPILGSNLGVREMRRQKKWLAGIAVISFLAMASQAYGDTITFGLIPGDGNVSGPPGSTVGWGYSVTNPETTDWFVPILLNSDSFANGTAFLLFDFPSVAPGATISVPFDPIAGVGLYGLTWDSGAPVGFVNSGNFVLSAGWWDGDPLNGGNFLFNEPDINLPYTATVTEGGPATVPEPSALWLLLTGLVATAWLKLFRRHPMRRVPRA
ncbi:MAG: PEP-CTERM sorting domain-containing protein [Acidobacteria bacterium]|nr:PEP-CTERM sorting domain-containing protein [Acidobacteriota bacterium]